MHIFVLLARSHKFGRQNQGDPSESDDENEYNSYSKSKYFYSLNKEIFMYILVHRYF